MIEDNNREFDLKIRSMMESAEEEAPSRVWDAIDSRLPHKDPILVPVWMRLAGVSFAVAAAVILTLTFTGTFNKSVSSIDFVEKSEAIVADVQEQEVEQPATIEVQDIVKPGSNKRSTKVNLIAEATEIKVESSADIIEKPSEVADSKPTRENQERKETETKELTPEQIEAYFNEDESLSNGKKISLDLKGIFGSNDGVSQKSLILDYMGAPTKDNTVSTGVYEKSTSVYGVPVSYNIGVRFYVAKKLSIGTGVTYTRLSRNFKGDFVEANEDGTGYSRLIKDADIINRQHYIGIPVNLYYDFLQTDFIQFYGFGGGSIEKGIADKYSITGENESASYNKSIAGLQYSVDAGLGIQFRIANNWGIFIDPSVRYYFDSKQPTSVRTAKPFMFNFEVGARFDLKK